MDATRITADSGLDDDADMDDLDADDIEIEEDDLDLDDTDLTTPIDDDEDDDLGFSGLEDDF